MSYGFASLDSADLGADKVCFPVAKLGENLRIKERMEKRLRLLIVEDEESIRNGLMDVFVFHGYEVDASADGKEGLSKALSGKYDMVLLDVMLPYINGFDILQRIREQDKEQAVIMLTAKSSDEEVILGLSLGADDYVAKPFSIAQLVLRVEAVLRRSHILDQQNNVLRINSQLEIDKQNLSGERAGVSFQFTRRELEVLDYLFANKQRPVPREELLNKVWGYQKEMEIETRTVDIHIAKLRRKIEPDAKNPTMLLTIRGAGYRLIVDE
ncbi:response regulator transcription factor [Aurantivibrio infirmus]